MNEPTKQSHPAPRRPHCVLRDSRLWDPRGPQRRLALTTTGVAEVAIRDCFTERIIDLHWREVAAYVSTGDPRRLGEFAGLVIDGRTLASSRDGVAACLRMAED